MSTSTGQRKYPDHPIVLVIVILIVIVIVIVILRNNEKITSP